MELGKLSLKLPSQTSNLFLSILAKIKKPPRYFQTEEI